MDRRRRCCPTSRRCEPSRWRTCARWRGRSALKRASSATRVGRKGPQEEEGNEEATMIAVDSWLRGFWLATWAHLWQTTLALVVIFLLARLIDSGPARLVNGLWWAGLAKLFLPLPFLGPLGARLGQALFSARGTAPSAAGRTGFETAAVFLDPRALADSSAPAAAG